MSLALSTSWNAHRCADAKQLLFEINRIGFKEIELSFNLESSTVEEIISLAAGMGIRIVSLHNFCPIPQGLNRNFALPDYYSMSSYDEQERSQAIKYAKKTIHTAYLSGAKAVVLHCGRVEVGERTRQLIGLYNKGLKDSPGFRRLKQEIIRERECLYAPFLNNTLRSLQELNDYAAIRKVLLGVETRFYYREIPAFEEIKIILERFKGSQIYYWHDTGHAQLMEMLGFAKHRDFLESYASRMIGVHLHDISAACEDHLAPFQGEINFNLLADYLKEDTIKVIEAHAPARPREIMRSRQLLEGIFHAPKQNTPAVCSRTILSG